MIGRLRAMFLFLAMQTCPVGASRIEFRDARISDVMGTLTLKPAEKPRRPVLITEETPLAVEDRLMTGPTSYAEITLDGTTVLRLQPESTLIVKNLHVR